MVSLCNLGMNVPIKCWGSLSLIQNCAFKLCVHNIKQCVQVRCSMPMLCEPFKDAQFKTLSSLVITGHHCCCF